MNSTGGLPRASGLRLLRFVVFANSVGISVLAALVAVTFLLNANRVDQINQERQRNIEADCRLASAQNRAIVDFLTRVNASERTLEAARAHFPTPSADECSEHAAGRVSK